MDKLLGFVCALLCAWNAEAAVTSWAATGGVAAITVGGTAPAGSATIYLQSSLAVGATLFTVTATANPAIASYTFDATDGNPATHGAIAVSTSGAVTLAKAIDYPTVKQVIFKVVATDTTPTTPLTGTFTMTVNFGPSTDSAYSFCVADPTPLGTTIGKATASATAGTWAVMAGGDAAKFTVAAGGSITTAAQLKSSGQVYYTATLQLTDAGATTNWPLHVLVDNSCLCSGVAHVISGVAMIVMTVLASTVL
ncbi:uncharacterized protein LOC127847274 isoform X2 [Dreissena polymorpha]|uniref:uncharacterized protein LOC127847274 isoform X2 n=1 Tax=Dreissena polymorpha TaxID=45954 RepID=UPI002264D3FE|nr:uncharacterized protein LOC127847274 isoform X2 [Dreissena polymorpha]